MTSLILATVLLPSAVISSPFCALWWSFPIILWPFRVLWISHSLARPFCALCHANRLMWRPFSLHGWAEEGSNPNLWVQKKIKYFRIVLPLAHHIPVFYTIKKFGLFFLAFELFWPPNKKPKSAIFNPFLLFRKVCLNGLQYKI